VLTELQLWINKYSLSWQTKLFSLQGQVGNISSLWQPTQPNLAPIYWSRLLTGICRGCEMRST